MESFRVPLKPVGPKLSALLWSKLTAKNGIIVVGIQVFQSILSKKGETHLGLQRHNWFHYESSLNSIWNEWDPGTLHDGNCR